MTRHPISPKCETADVIEALDAINRAIVGAETTTSLLSGVLDEMLRIFGCDRTWVLRPGSRDSEFYRVAMERTRPEWQSAGSLQDLISVDEFSRAALACCVEEHGPVSFGPERPPEAAGPLALERLGVRSQLLMALHLRHVEPWVLGLHHCSEAKSYHEARKLFRAIGERVASGLTTLHTTRALRQSEERFRTLVDHAPEAIVILDCDAARFVEANPEATRLFGVRRDQLLEAAGPLDFSPEHQPDGQRSVDLIATYVGAAIAGEVPTFEWVHTNAAGDHIPCEVRLVRLPHPERRLVRGSVTDISERKRAEQERIELEARLAQSQKMEALGQLTGGIAHDFNNLLTVIMGNLELVAESAVPDEVRDDVRYAAAAAEKAAHLTQRLLAFSRRQPLRPTVLDVGRLLQGMDSLLRRTLGEEVEITIRLADDLWPCEADASQLESALLNLAINSRDAMPGGGRLVIAARNLPADAIEPGVLDELTPGDYVRISVRDTGEGIAPDIKKEVFSPFFTTKEVGRGSGLGLSMVYGFIKQSGGHVRIESEVGLGTTMNLFLPRATPGTPVSEPQPSLARDTQGTGETILVVEDDEDVRKLTFHQLTQLGYHALQAYDGRSALTLLSHHPEVDLLLTDVILPGGMNGAQLAQRARGARPDLRVLYMSGYTQNVILHQGRLDPGVNLVEKPFTKATLALRVREELDRRA